MQGMDNKQDDFGYVPKKQAAGIYAVVDRKVPCKGTGVLQKNVGYVWRRKYPHGFCEEGKYP